MSRWGQDTGGIPDAGDEPARSDTIFCLIDYHRSSASRALTLAV
jgi:hypothetical protein